MWKVIVYYIISRKFISSVVKSKSFCFMPGKRDITVSKAETFLETQYFIPKLRRMFTSEKSTEYSFKRELGILKRPFQVLCKRKKLI